MTRRVAWGDTVWTYSGRWLWPTFLYFSGSEQLLFTDFVGSLRAYCPSTGDGIHDLESSMANVESGSFDSMGMSVVK